MNLAAKIFLGVVGGGGSLSAASYGVYELTRPKTIGEKLLWEGKVLLNTTEATDDTTWQSLHTKYQSDSSDKFKEGETNKTLSAHSDLKNHCKTVLTKKLSEATSTDDLKKAGYWCVKDSSKLTN